MPRLHVHVGEGAEVSLIESYATVGEHTATLTSAVADIALAPSRRRSSREGSGRIARGVSHRGDGRAFVALEYVHIAVAHVRRQADEETTSPRCSTAEGAECTLNGLYVVGGDSLVDNHTLIDHAQPHCPSHEVYKGILSGRAKAVFNGKIVVRQDAQKTNAKQTNKALLLSDDAQVNTKPQLEIFADDVKCTHGAAIGQLDDDALFYLRARGIHETDARALLIHAFAGEILESIGSPAVKAAMQARLDRALGLTQ